MSEFQTPDPDLPIAVHLGDGKRGVPKPWIAPGMVAFVFVGVVWSLS